MKVILSYGMGVESSAILARWVFEPETRPCDLGDLVVVTAQTGDEYADTGRDVTEYILPLMRQHGIRYVQLARHGRFEAAGITVLEDSNSPTPVYLHGDYRLSDELRSNGTVPQFGGEHRCSLKFKAFVIETWLKHHQTGQVRHAFGYNAAEMRRVAQCESAIGTPDCIRLQSRGTNPHRQNSSLRFFGPRELLPAGGVGLESGRLPYLSQNDFGCRLAKECMRRMPVQPSEDGRY